MEKTYTKLDIAKQLEPEKSKQKAMKQRVARHIKEHHIKPIQIVIQSEHYSEDDKIAIIKYFIEIGFTDEALRTTSKAVHDTVFDTLLKQLEIKDKQIADLTEQNKLLMYKTMSRKEKRVLALTSGNQGYKKWYQFWRKGT